MSIFVKYFNNIIYLFFVLIFSIKLIFAQQLDFKKQNNGVTTSFSYKFLNAQNEEKQLFFQLDNYLIEKSQNEIPSLTILNTKIHKELPNAAYNLAQKQFKNLKEDYQKHKNKLNDIVFNTIEKIGVGFELNVKCPKEPIEYKFELKKIPSLSYVQKIKTLGCDISSNSKDAYKLMIEEWKIFIKQAKNILPKEVTYQLIKTGEGYNIKSKIPEMDSASFQNAKKIIQRTNKMIDKSEKNFIDKQAILKNNFKKIVNFNENFYNKFQIKARNKFVTIEKEIEKSNTSVYSEYYLKIEKKIQANVEYNLISPDYVKLVEKYVESMSVVSKSLLDDRLNSRYLIENALNFLQSIPYNDLQDRGLESFTGFLTAYSVLNENRGDCDSKSIALLSILKTLTPNIQTIMVLIPKHAFIAVSVIPQEGDDVISYQGVDYVIAEPAGPAVYKLGQSGASSKKAIKNNNFETIISF